MQLPLRRWLAVVLSLGFGISGAFAADAGSTPDSDSDNGNSFHVGGYVRAMSSINLQNPPETAGDDRYDVSMLRGTAELNADAKTGPLQWKAIARVDREDETNYLYQLQQLNKKNSPGGPGSNITSLYNYAELREFYFDADPTDRLHLRIGKQQVAWGETDFFHIMDVIQGYDYRWHSFLEADNDELRKPLIMANATLAVPELNGALQVLVRPGLDPGKDIGITYDLSGGRWALQPHKGIDFLAPGNVSYNYHHPDGDISKTTGGVRWTGSTGDLSYSLSYVNSFNPNPIVSSAFVAPYMGVKPQGIGEFIYPEITMYGASLSGNVDAIDAVLAAEIGYEKDAPYNVGSNFFGGQLPGWGGIMKKKNVLTSVRFDKQFKTMSYLGTSQASFFSIQLFDTWIQDYKKTDDMVDLAGFGAPAKEHTTLLTGFLVLNFMNNKVNPGLIFGKSLSSGDTFLVPNINFQIGDHLRLGIEADLFFANHQKLPGQVETSSYFLGNLANNDQLMARLTYQF